MQELVKRLLEAPADQANPELHSAVKVWAGQPILSASDVAPFINRLNGCSSIYRKLVNALFLELLEKEVVTEDQVLNELKAR